MARISELEYVSEDTLELALTPDEYNAMIAANGDITYNFALYNSDGNVIERGGARKQFPTNASAYRFDADTNEYIAIRAVDFRYYNHNSGINDGAGQYEGLGLYSNNNGVIAPVEGYYIGRGTDASQYDLTVNNGPMAGTSFKFIDVETLESGATNSSIRWDFPKRNQPINGSTDFYNTGVACFAEETLIKTPKGVKKISDLKQGDEVVTLDNGVQSIKWIGCRKVNNEELKANPKLLPVRITAGALGENLPERDLLVSRQHRILCRFSGYDKTAEVLVAAIKLAELPQVYVDNSVEEIEYYHILCDKHEIVFAEGMETETLFTGSEALNALSFDALEEIKQIFPELVVAEYKPEPARPILTGKMQKELVRQALEETDYCIVVSHKTDDLHRTA